MPAVADRADQTDAVVMQEPALRARRPLVPLARALQARDMQRLGQRRTGALARAFNRRGKHYVRFRTSALHERGDELLHHPAQQIEMRDGFAIDDSRTLPHLEAALAAGADLIDRYGGRKWEHEKPFLQNINPEGAIDEHPSLLDFITSPQVVSTVTPCFGYIPPLSGLLPRGVRLMESSTTFDPDAEGPWRESQLYHLDYHSSPTVYVIVALRDIGPDDGPLHFIGRAASRRVTQALNYGARGVPYRLTDARVHALVDESEVHRFCASAGTVLFLESSACLHLGSRLPVRPRYQLQYAFVSPVRNDFLELWRPQRVYPVGHGDSLLRRLVLDRTRLNIND